MADLLDTLRRVAERIDRYGSKGINEQDTKATLIQPVLRALGWDVEDLEDVQREYKIRKQDKPVDFALFLLRTPCFFVEAKGLGQNLDDRKWANQIMGYAGVAGVGWVVLTDGNEYRLYNSHATVPIEEKLFRSVKVMDDAVVTSDTLALLSKERMKENEIDVLWNAHFVDRQVKAAVRDLFSPTPDPSVIRLVARKVANLSPKEIRASLQRASLSFDFPVKPDANNRKSSDAKVRPVNRGAATPRGRDGRVTKRFRNLGISMSQVVPQLVRKGILSTNTTLFADFREKSLTATISADGQIEFRGATYKSPSAAGAAAKQFVTGKYVATDGWYFWHFIDADGKRVPLSKARLAYFAEQ